MIEFTDAHIVNAKVSKWQGGHKELRLRLDTPRPPRGTLSSMPQVEHLCLWALTGKTQGYGGHTYHQVIGRWGPFLHTAYVALEPQRPEKPELSVMDWYTHQESEDTWKPPRPDWIGEFIDGETRSMWRGILYGCRDFDLDGRFINIGYSSVEMGNGFRTHIESTYLQRILERFDLDWIIIPNSHQEHVATIEPRVLQPHACCKPHIFLNAQNKTTFGATLAWMVDDHARREDLFFGAWWPSEAALQAAIDTFIQVATANPPRNIFDTRKLIPGAWRALPRL